MPKATKTTTRATAVLKLTKSEAERFLARVPEDKVFWSHDGRVLKELKDLKDALSEMSDQVFTYHANEMKNDFSNWVRDVIGDQALARELEKAGHREQAAKIVEEHYNLLSSKLK